MPSQLSLASRTEAALQLRGDETRPECDAGTVQLAGGAELTSAPVAPASVDPLPPEGPAGDAIESLRSSEAATASIGSESPHWEEEIRERVRQLIERTRSSRFECDPDLLERAYEFAAEKHTGQKRMTGEPYIEHPIAVAGILAELGMDDVTIAAGLLHDVPEDCGVSYDEMYERFGADVAHLVDGVTKLKKIKFSSKQDKQAENLRKLFIAMSGDVRVIIVKLADRLHNMRTLDPFSERKKVEIATETLHIFAPIAHRLGIWRIKWELEDRSFKYLQPDVYKQIYAMVHSTRAERNTLVQDAIEKLQAHLAAEHIDAEVTGRPKHFYSIYQKMIKQNLKFEAVHDLTALRVICHTKQDCYHALGATHALWTPVESMFFDYIGRPKPNQYQSLHTKVRDANSQLIEVQIRTQEMHRQAEFGIAAHWRYKQGDRPEQNFGDKLRWLRVVLEIDNQTRGDAQGFLDGLKLDLSNDQIFAFTPQGDVVYLPQGSSPIDFAFRVHSEVGNKCIAAKINNRIVPLNHKLHNGDICEIETSRSSSGPKRGWLDFVITPLARNRIKAYLRKQAFEDNHRYGLERLEKAARSARLKLGSVAAKEELEKCARAMGVKNAAELLAGIGYGEFSAENVLNRIRAQLVSEIKISDEAESVSSAANSLLQRPMKLDEAAESSDDSLEFGRTTGEIQLDPTRAGDMLYTLGRCCAPIPGDEVRGYITRGRGVTVHRTDCPNLKHYEALEPDRILQASWTGLTDRTYATLVALEADDRTGLLAEICTVMAARKINITATSTYPLKNNRARMNFAVTIDNHEQLQDLMRVLATVEGVHDVHRV